MFNDLHNEFFTFIPLNATTLCRLLLFGDPSLSDERNHAIISAVINYILSTSRFGGSLFE